MKVKSPVISARALTRLRLPGQKQSGELPEQAEVHGGYDPLVTETSTFWQNHGESNDAIRHLFRLKYSVCLRPALLKRWFYR